MPVLTDFDETYALVDNNQKASGGALQLFSDEFGNTLDAHWTAGFLEFFAAGSSALEAGGTNTLTCKPPGAGWADYGIYIGLLFGDGSFEMEVEAATMQWAAGVASQIRLQLWINVNNQILVYRSRDLTAGLDTVRLAKVVGGVTTVVANVAAAGILTFKLKVVRSGDNFDCYYDIGAGWAQYPGCPFAAAIGSPARLYCSAYRNVTPGSDCVAPLTRVAISGTGVYWNDSPEFRVIAAPGVDYAGDAGAGSNYNPRFFAAIVTTPGTSSIKWKLGHSDTGLEAGVTWLDGAWRTTAEVLANCLAGAYDGKRYLHIKGQHNSDGTAQTILTSVEIDTEARGGSDILQEAA